MNPTVRQYNFSKKPEIGNIVKVYCSKHECMFGYVCGFFIRREIRKDEVDPKGRIIHGYNIETECVLLKPLLDVAFNRIDYFLDLDRVDFVIK